MTNEPVILAIDTSCDETAAAVTMGTTILSSVMPSQMKLHSKYGGVVPSIAKLEHAKKIDKVIDRALKQSGKNISQIDAIAVTVGPGLAIALEIGIKKAKDLAESNKKPLIIVNHMEGHLLSSLARQNSQSQKKELNIEFPSIGLLVSGGHTELILVESIGSYKKIGETLDDACGESFDKCGRMLGLGYPAGPVISTFAKQHRSKIEVRFERRDQSIVVVGRNRKTGKEYELPVPMSYTKEMHFSYSGLKTAFKNLIEKCIEENSGEISKEEVMDLCVIFEASALQQLVNKLELAIKLYSPKEVWLGGGVVASARLRYLVRKLVSNTDIKLRFPYSKKLTGDNAAMIGVVAGLKALQYGLNHFPEQGIYIKNFEKIDRDPNLSL